MIGSFPTCRARVLCFGSSSIDREPVAVRTCARLRWRAHSDINPGLNRTSNPASHPSAATTPPGSGNWRTAVERPKTLALAVRHLLPIHRDMWPGILNLTGYLSRWSFRTLLQSFQESSCVQIILSRPYLSLLAVAHGSNHAAGAIGNAQKCLGEFRNVVR